MDYGHVGKLKTEKELHWEEMANICFQMAV
jgi:hypothetical protein